MSLICCTRYVCYGNKYNVGASWWRARVAMKHHVIDLWEGPLMKITKPDMKME